MVALLAEVSLLLTVAASHSRHVARLVTVFRDMALLTTVAASTAATALRTIFGKVTHYNS
ncbi:hypothetical protein LB505_005076 [Fusarium chuoi]|nr:hypothetical protein LB505_005076 [Fusarium chuoi]